MREQTLREIYVSVDSIQGADEERTGASAD